MIPRRVAFFLCIFLCAVPLGKAVLDDSGAALPPTWIDPPVCAPVPLNPARHQSPPLRPENQKRSLRLKQVQTIIRHGLRVASGGAGSCWFGAFPESWNCDCPEVMSLPSGDTLRFEKYFDAAPEFNRLNGTCEFAQLAPEGAAHMEDLGKLFAQSYLISSSPMKIPLPETPPLFTEATITKRLVLRAADEHCMRMSTAALVIGMLTEGLQKPLNELPPLSLHTTDPQDYIMLADGGICPAADEANQRAFSSAEYKELLKSFSDVKRDLEDVLGKKIEGDSWIFTTTECFVLGVCGHRTELVPKELWPTTPEGRALGRKMLDVTVAVNDFDYNASVYSRLTMSYLVREIRQNLRTAFMSSEPKLHIYMGGRRTITAFLTSINLPVGDVPAYSSAVILEVFSEQIETREKHFFRLIYNGKMMTDMLSGCDQELCDVSAFFNVTNWVDENIAICEASAKQK